MLHVIGTAYDDVITGSDLANSLNGSGGNDLIRGGAGADTLDGGAGRDTLDFTGSSSAVSINLSAGAGAGAGGDAEGDTFANFEGVVGSTHDDTFTVDGGTQTNLAGLGGNDTFYIEGGGGAPTVVWGGTGADTVNIASTFGQYHDPIGIMVVNVAGLTDANFHDFDLSMVNVGAGFDWSEIDVVVLNPESQDTLTIDGSVVSVSSGSLPAIYYNAETQSNSVAGSYGYQQASDISDWFSGDQKAAGDYSVSFLGGGVDTVFAAASTIGFWEVTEFFDSSDQSYVGAEVYDYEDSLKLDLDTDTFTGQKHKDINDQDVRQHFWVSYTATPDGSTIPNSWPVENPFASGAASMLSLGAFTSASEIGPWFVVGGKFGSTGLTSTGTYSASMPLPPQGAGTGATSLSSGGGSHTILNFSVTSNALVVNGSPLNPNAAGGAVTVSQNGADTVIRDNGVLLATLAGVSLSAWQTAAAAQSLGTASDDTLVGTGAANLFAAGAGNDTITAGAGDDTILYTSGNDVIVGNATKNTGLDTLDLSKYTASQVHFAVNSSHDVIITTPDGTIELDYQVRNTVGNVNSNIERIVFADMTIDEAAIRTRALGDQSTAGNDSVQGSIVNDVFIDGAGNDTIIAGGGDDTIVYGSGNDLIDGHGTTNSGLDTLDLSKYSSSQVKFAINTNHDVLITTPDGAIELDYQVRYAVGNVNSNIERIVFSDMTIDEAAIRTRALGDQSTSGNDSVQGSIVNDVFIDAAGNDTIIGGGGDDTIVYGSGNDVIDGHGTTNSGFDTLDLSKYSSSQVKFGVNSSYDVLVTTPDGIIELDYQVRYANGDTKSNIERILLSNASLDEAAIRVRAVADQATAGNDIILGTGTADRVAGGAGNDTLTGGAGADTFLFAVGGGNDRITDFLDGTDHIEFAGRTFSDLTITQSGSNSLIDYGAGDSVLVLGIASTALTQSDFVFV